MGTKEKFVRHVRNNSGTKFFSVTDHARHNQQSYSWNTSQISF